MGWGDRFKERMRQGTHISKDLHHFKGTDNDRVKSMLKETDDFASKLKSFKKHVAENSSAIIGLIKSTHKTFSAPLPRIYEREGDSNAVPSMTQDHSAASLRINDLTMIEQKMESDLKSDVYGPINSWLDVHKEFSGKMTQLENRRLELDNARRLHGRAELERVRSLQKSDRVEPEVAAKLDTQNADADAKRVAYTQYETDVHAQLSGLITDAANMHSIFAQAYRILGGALQSVLASGAPHLTHEQMAGAPNAMRAIEHHMHSTNISGPPLAHSNPGSGNYGPPNPGTSYFPPPNQGGSNFGPPPHLAAQHPAGNYGTPSSPAGKTNPFL